MVLWCSEQSGHHLLMYMLNVVICLILASIGEYDLWTFDIHIDHGVVHSMNVHIYIMLSCTSGKWPFCEMGLCMVQCLKAVHKHSVYWFDLKMSKWQITYHAPTSSPSHPKKKKKKNSNNKTNIICQLEFSVASHSLVHGVSNGFCPYLFQKIQAIMLWYGTWKLHHICLANTIASCL